MNRLALGLLVVGLTEGCAEAATTGPASPDRAAHSTAKDPKGPGGVFELNKTVELLGGSVRVRVPQSAEVSARPHMIMAAAAPVEEETRVILVPGDERARFVLMATEGFARGTGDPARDAALWLGDDAKRLNLEPVRLGRGLVGVLLVPREPLPAEDRPLYVLGGLVERADHTVVELAFFILPEMASRRSLWRARATAIVKSLSAGQAPAPLKREHRVSAWGGKALLLKLPRPAVMTRQDGPDFTVYHFREIPNVGEEAGTIGIYFGGHPSFQHSQMGGGAAVNRAPGHLLGQEVDWHTWEVRPGRRMSEAIASMGAHTEIHAFVSGPEQRVGEIRAAVEQAVLVDAQR